VEHDDGSYVFHGDRCTETKLLEVHHKHYDSLGAEKDEDLEVLCRFHHLVREVGRIVCEFCALETVVPCEEDAIDMVQSAVEERGTGNITLDMVDVPADCFNCVEMLSKDD
jgi:hypothetical protein